MGQFQQTIEDLEMTKNYTFNDLTDAAKKHALKESREAATDWPWWEDIEKELKKRLKKIGLDISAFEYSASSPHTTDFHFCGNYHPTKELIPTGDEPLDKISAELFEFEKENDFAISSFSGFVKKNDDGTWDGFIVAGMPEISTDAATAQNQANQLAKSLRQAGEIFVEALNANH